MRHLLRRIATSLRRLSFLPVGYNRTLNLYNLLSVQNSIYRVFVISIASSICIAIFGVGLHHFLDELITLPPNDNTSIKRIILSSVLACSAWIFMVSLNHIHDLTGLWADISHYYELIWWIPAYISVALIGPFFNFIWWGWTSVVSGIPYPFTDLTAIREVIDFVTQTMPVFFSYLWSEIADKVSAIITFQDIRDFGNMIYDGIVYCIASVLFYLSPSWVQDTRIGRWAVITASSTILAYAIFRFIMHLIW